jgi:hypothetical protein
VGILYRDELADDIEDNLEIALRSFQEILLLLKKKISSISLNKLFRLNNCDNNITEKRERCSKALLPSG